MYDHHTMEKRAIARAGGAAAAVGFEYQKFVTAWAAAHILSESPVSSLFDLPSERLAILRTETEQPVDDLMLVTASGGVIFAQVKHSLSFSAAPGSALASVVDQCVRQFVAPAPIEDGTAPKPWERPLDLSRDRIVVIARSLPAALADGANRLLSKIRVEPFQGLEDAVVPAAQASIGAVLNDHVCRSWTRVTGRTATPAEVAACLRPLLFVKLDVEGNGRDAVDAKTQLQRVVRDPQAIDVSWATLANLAERLIATRGGADRATLQQALTESRITVNAAPSYERDIERLKLHSARVRFDLANLAVLHLAGEDIRIDRAIAPALVAAAREGSWLLTGSAGSGKSGVLFGFAEDASRAGADVVVLAVDHINATSLRQLRDELDLEHDLTDVLANWPVGEQAYFVIDALDAARSPATLDLTRQLLRALLDRGSRWHVVASVREFDLFNSPQLQRLFAGRAHEAHFDPALPRVRHIRVRELLDSELQQVTLLAPSLGELVTASGPEMLALLRIPFHLRLLVELLDEGAKVDQLASIRTRAELLERYWSWRVLGDADPDGVAREELLRAAVRHMVGEKSMRLYRETLAASPVFSSSALDKLLSNSVLALWRSPYRSAPERDVLTFAHHILFDYAASRLVLRRDPVAELQADPEMILSFRPSLVMHAEYLWIVGPDHYEFWSLAASLCADNDLTAMAKTVVPAVATKLAVDIGDFETLLQMLPAAPGATEAARHVFGALLADQPNASMVGHPRALWAVLMERLSASIDDVLAYAIRASLMTATDEIDRTTEAEREALSRAAVNLASYSRVRPEFDRNLMIDSLRAVCRTFSANPIASRKVIEEALRPENLERSVLDEVYWISRELRHVMTVDPQLVGIIYRTAFMFEVTDDRQVPLGGGALLSLTTTSRQQQQTTLHSLMDQFGEFLRNAPALAIPILAFIVEDYVQRKETFDYSTVPAAPLQILGVDAWLKEDASRIWDTGSVAGPDIAPLLDTFEEYVVALKAAPETEDLLRLYARHTRAAVGWARILRAATAAPASIGLLLRELAWSIPILTDMDTTVAAGNFIRAVTPHLSHSERERVERAIMSIPEQPDDARSDASTLLRNRLLGVIDPASVVTHEARALRAHLSEGGGPPPNEPLFRFSGGFVDHDDEDYLRDLRVPTQQPQTKRLLALLRPVKEFSNRHTNGVPSNEDIVRIAPALAHLHEYLINLGNALHNEATGFAWGYIAETAAEIVRTPDFEQLPVSQLVLATLRQAAAHPQPPPQRDEDFRTPGWGGPAARISAAEGLIRAGRFATYLDDDLKRTLNQLARDPNPAVRFQIASGLPNLYYTDLAAMWDLAQRFASDEGALGVLQGFVGGTLMPLAQHVPERIVPLVLEGVLIRLAEIAGDARTVRDYCFDIVVGLYLWQDNEACGSYVSDIVSNLLTHSDDASRIASNCATVFERSDAAPAKADETARHRAFDTLVAILDAAATVRDQPLQSDALHKLASLITHIGLLIYRTAMHPSEDEDAGEPSQPFSAIEPLLERLATFGYPMLAHHLLQTLQSFVATAPERVFRLVGLIVEAAARYGYHYESEAERLIVRLLKRYMAEYPTVLRTIDGRRTFLDILDRFVQAGWPAARRLTYGLEDRFR
jgi:hypothetical protein